MCEYTCVCFHVGACIFMSVCLHVRVCSFVEVGSLGCLGFFLLFAADKLPRTKAPVGPFVPRVCA